MLQQISVRNFALIKDTKLEFQTGLNVLTGETGAGKSILLDAIRLVLGERLAADQKFVRDLPSQIEAIFNLPAGIPVPENLLEFLEEGDECLILKREISPEGRSKCSVNRQSVNLSVLKSIGSWLIDFHGQYDQQNIFREETHLELIDRLAGLRVGTPAELMTQYSVLYKQYKEVRRKQRALANQSENKQRQLELLDYQIQEIEEVSPKENEEENLIQEKVRLGHAQKLYELTDSILGELEEGDHSASTAIQNSFRYFSQWTKIDESSEKLQTEFEDVQIRFEELLRTVRDYRDGLSFDDDKLNELEARVSALANLKRKYGPELKDVLSFLEKTKSEYDALINVEVYQQDLEIELGKILPQLTTLAEKISKLRAKSAEQLKQSVEKELKDLGILHACFDVKLAKVTFNEYGCELASFLFCPNPGQPMSPLVKVASGGEASRILLALKRALAEVDATPTLIFDEIDANIGGRLGEVVGRKLREIADERQIMLITHLPQIASFSNCHYKVTKSVEKGQTEVAYELLDEEQKVQELAQMMSGERETDISRDHAKEMIKTASK